MTEPSKPLRRRTNGMRPDAFAVAVGAAAMFAPASLTGVDPLDAAWRGLIAAYVAYVGSHGRRWAWVVAAFAICVGAQGASLAVAIVGLAIMVGASVPRRRPRAVGAIGIGVLVNAVFWYPPESAPLGPLLAVVAMAILVGSGLPFVRSSRRRVAKVALGVVAGVVVLAAAGAGISMLLAYGNVNSGASAAKAALQAARAGDPESAQIELAQAQEDFERAHARVDGVLALPARAIPGLSQQLRAVRITVQQGTRISEAADEIVATADYENLQYQGRLDLTQVQALAGPTARADAVLADADGSLDGLRSGSLLPPLRSAIDEFADQITEARRDTALAADLLRVTPGLFGADGQRHYLVIFITPAELRGAGGFIGSYAELTATNGDVELTRSGRIVDLILGAKPGTRTIAGPADYVRRYGRFHPEEFLQDDTFSANFPSSASVIAQMYAQSGGQPVDGVIGVDPTGLAALLELTGPVQVPGLTEPLTADNAVEVLTRSQYITVPDDAARGQILTEATRVTFDVLTSASLPSPRKLADTLSPAARAGHLRTWSPRPSEQTLFRQLGADGTLAIPTGYDGFSVVQQNTGNNKIDAYLQRTITYEPTIDAATGALEATMRISLHNAVPTTDLPRAVVGNNRGAPVGTSMGWLTIYTPNVVTSATIDGKPLSMGPSSERALNAFDTPLWQIPPGGTIVIEAKLAGSVDLSKGYRLRILPQPVANADQMTVDLSVQNGRTAEGSNRKTRLQGGPVDTPTTVRAPITR